MCRRGTFRFPFASCCCPFWLTEITGFMTVLPLQRVTWLSSSEFLRRVPHVTDVPPSGVLCLLVLERLYVLSSRFHQLVLLFLANENESFLASFPSLTLEHFGAWACRCYASVLLYINFFGSVLERFLDLLKDFFRIVLWLFLR